MSAVTSVLKVIVNDIDGSLYPNEPQYGGVYGDNEALILEFAPLDEAYRYQIEVVDGSGCYDVTLPLAVQDGKICYAVPSAWTAPGTAAVRLVAVGEGAEPLLRHYAPLYLQFSDREQGNAMGEMLPRWQTVMADSETAAEFARASAYNADVAALEAREAAEIARQAKGPKGDTGPQGPKGDKGDDHVLHVTVTGNKTSHTPAEIKAFVDEGGLAVLGDGFFLYQIDAYSATFRKCVVGTNRQVRMDEVVVFSDIDEVSTRSKFYSIFDVDSTLTLENQAADAKVVGDRLAALEQQPSDGLISFEDDGKGNVTLRKSGEKGEMIDDGDGNVKLEVM